MKLESRDTRWSPIKALAQIDVLIDELGVPKFNFDLESVPILEFSDLMNASNRDLSEFLVAYGGYKAFLESQIADAQAKKNALTAAFDEGFATAVFRIADERETAGQKKLTRDEIRGAVMDKYEQLKELKREIIEQEAIETRINGLLYTYTTAYNTVSRVVTLRMENTTGRGQ